MRAAAFTEHGGLDVIRVIDDLPIPEPQAGQARIRMQAAALNRLDLWVRIGWKGLNLVMPHVIGSDGAGIVDAIGAGVTHVAPGDRVSINPTLIDEDCLSLRGSEDECLDIQIIGEHAQGVAAEYVVLPARNLHKLPDHVSFVDAAAAGLVFVTAWYSLIDRGGAKAGESVLIVGAGGGVNSASIQIAKLAGCTVYVVGSSESRCAQAELLGADVIIDRSKEENWSKTLYKLTQKQGVDIVIDNVGQATIVDSIRSVKRGGRILVVGNTSGYDAQIDLRYLFSKRISIIGSSMGPTSAYARVMALVAEGKLKPVVGATFPLSQARDAQAALESGDVFGKVVIEI
jgi:NADPH:quinone reductase-like Zn-dependent oxidoreductase